MKFFRSEMTPPPFGNFPEIFRKFIRFRGDSLPLEMPILSKMDEFLEKKVPISLIGWRWGVEGGSKFMHHFQKFIHFGEVNFAYYVIYSG